MICAFPQAIFSQQEYLLPFELEGVAMNRIRSSGRQTDAAFPLVVS